jgi:acyl-coenzyme A thioesterase PaaI-like protein
VSSGNSERRGTWRAWLVRQGFNLFPAWRRTGARIAYIAPDWSVVRVRLPLNWTTRNYVGTTFGGSLYGAMDPIYMIQLIKILGPEYVVWDKAATIRFRRPGRATLYATFRVTPEQVDAIRREVDALGRSEPEYVVELVDAEGEVHASCSKLLSIKRRERGPGP